MFKKSNEKGFTLIELMIVIAIIGILAAIAIPNFISYRDKSFCSGTESDANTVAGAIAEYFSIPANTSVQDTSLVSKGYITEKLSNKNTWKIDASNIKAIAITVTDETGRCPGDYRSAMNAANDPRGYWSGSNYIKILAN